MKRLSVILASLALTTSLNGFADDARTVAETTTARWNAAFALGRLDEILALYAPNAMLVKPDGRVSGDFEEIRAFWRALIDKGQFAVDLVEAHRESVDTIVVATRFADIKPVAASQAYMRYSYDGLLYRVLERQSDGIWRAKAQRWATTIRGGSF